MAMREKLWGNGPPAWLLLYKGPKTTTQLVRK